MMDAEYVRKLYAASDRLGARYEYARAGIPAWSHRNNDGTVPAHAEPLVQFAPPWAEDPRTVSTLLERVEHQLVLEEGRPS